MPYVNVGTHRLWVTEKAAGTPVVLLHSLFFDHRVFEPIEDALAEEHRVIQVDLRDHGRSGGPEERWSLADAASEVERALTQLDVGPAHVVGLSMGGMVALRWALAHPERVRSLGLVSTTAKPEPQAWLHKAMAHGVRFGGRLAVDLVMPYMLGKMFAEPTRSGPEADEWRRRIAATDPARLYRAGQAVFDRADVTDRLGAIEVPALTVTGAQDTAIPPAHGRQLAEQLDEGRHVEIERAGHILPIEAPDRLADALVRFLRRAEASSASSAENSRV